jgi:quinol monooxygenase YgiN
VAEIQVVAVLKVKEGKVDLVKEAFAKLTAASRQDTGCVRYDLYEADDAPGTLVNLETWASPEDLTSHMQQPHLGEAFASGGDAFDGAPQIYMLKPVDVA